MARWYDDAYDELVGAADTALAVASPIVAEPFAGWAGILSGGDPEAVRYMQERMTWAPKTQEGMRNLGVLGQGIQSALDYQPPLSDRTLGQDFQAIGDYWRDTSIPALQETFGDELGSGIGAAGLGILGVAGGPARYTRHVPDLKKTPAGYVESPRLLDLDPRNPPADVTQVGKKRELLRKPAVREREKYRSGGETIRELDESPEEIIVSPEDLQGGVLVPHLGDKTIAGGRLLQVGGVPLSRTVELEGGPGFSRLHSGTGRGWASNLGPARGLQANIDLAAKETGLDPYGIYTAMGPYASNFSTHVADAALAQLDRLPISRKAKAAFDERMGALVAPLRNVEQFVGLDSPELRDQLMGTGGHSQAGAGKLRTIFAKEMEQARHRDEGFPVMEEIYDAVNEPLLADANIGDAGATLFRGRPGAHIVPEGQHGSYTHDILGDYVGALDRGIPAQVAFPRLWERTGQARDRRGNPLTEGQRINAIQTGHTYEVADQEWVDSVSKWLEQNRLQGGFIDPRLLPWIGGAGALGYIATRDRDDVEGSEVGRLFKPRDIP